MLSFLFVLIRGFENSRDRLGELSVKFTALFEPLYEGVVPGLGHDRQDLSHGLGIPSTNQTRCLASL